MLSDEQLLAIHNDAANSEPLYGGPDLKADLDKYSLRGLRAVEAAVREDQIEKDAALADCWGTSEARNAIRAQVEGE
jgi:hypothetical protein